MGKISLIVTAPRKLLAEDDVYEIIPIAELSSLLKDGCSLSLAFHGEFVSGGYMMGTFNQLRGTWITPDGDKKEDRVLFSVLPAEIQSSAKNCLDKTFSGQYLFCSWKKDGSRTFKLGQQGKTLAEYATFDEGIAVLISGRFIPRGIYYRKYNYIEMMGLIARKRNEQRKLFRRLLRCIRHSMYRKYAKDVIQRFDVAVVPYSAELYAALLVYRFGITRVEDEMLVFNRRKFLLEHDQKSCRGANREYVKSLTEQYPDKDFYDELVELLMRYHISQFSLQREGRSIAEQYKLDILGGSIVPTKKLIWSDKGAELDRIANEMERLQLNPLRKQNPYYLLERILCRETFEKLSINSKWQCSQSVRKKDNAAK